MGRNILGLVIHSYWIRAARPLDPGFSSLRDPLAFVEHAATLGAAGVQTSLGSKDADYVARLRAVLERRSVYFEGSVALPANGSDVARFTSELESAKSAGASVVRTVCLSGRRYETFRTAEQFKEFSERSWQSLQWAESQARKLKLQLAVENHKDWRVNEMLTWLKRLDSEFAGVCLDTGNSIALLEEPHAVVEALAPWTMTVHLKDMSVREYNEGFLLSEVPLGEGFLDLPRIVRTIHKARPAARLNLEMITRDPLQVPCLTPGYWATFPTALASELAAALARVHTHRSQQPLPQVTGLEHRAQLQAEAENIARSLKFAEKLAE